MDPCIPHRYLTTRKPGQKSPEKMLPAKSTKCESDRTQDIQELFSQLDAKFFQDKMKKNGVLLEWTEKHQMIHALLYTAGINENHGPNFRRIMKNINKVAGTNITVYHEFHDEVGRCKDLGKPKDEMHKPDKHIGFVKPPKVCVPPLHPDKHIGIVKAPKMCAPPLKPDKHVGIVKAPKFCVPPLQPDKHVGIGKSKMCAPPLKPDKHVGIVKAPKFCVPPLQPDKHVGIGKSPKVCVPLPPHQTRCISDKPKTRLRRVPSRPQDDLMSEILSSHKGAVPERHIKLIGFDDSEPDFDSSDSDFDFTDSDSDFEYDQTKAMKKKADDARVARVARDQLLKMKELFFMKEDLKPWMNRTIFCKRH